MRSCKGSPIYKSVRRVENKLTIIHNTYMSSLDDQEAPGGTPIIITINAGGTIFQTYQETLTRGSVYFQAYFHGGFSKPDPRKTIFLDMDPECFRCLLLRMRLPGCQLPNNNTTPGIRETAAFLGMELPPMPEEKKQMEYEANVALLGPAKQDVYELAVRLYRGDRVEVLYSNDTRWRTDTFCKYFPAGNFPWDFRGIRKIYLWWEDRPQIRVTDPAERAKILAREPDLTRVVFLPQ